MLQLEIHLLFTSKIFSMKALKLNSSISAVVILFLISVFFHSCKKEEISPNFQEDITANAVIESYVDEEYLAKEIQRLEDSEFSHEANASDPTNIDCRAGVRFVDLAGSPALANVPFYQGAFINELLRANGSCNFPTSLNQPCLFAGFFGFNTVPGMSGNFRILAGTATWDLGTISGSYSYQYGGLWPGGLPLGVYCGNATVPIIFQAEDVTTPGNWITVAAITFTCSNCRIQPF